MMMMMIIIINVGSDFPCHIAIPSDQQRCKVSHAMSSTVCLKLVSFVPITVDGPSDTRDPLVRSHPLQPYSVT